MIAIIGIGAWEEYTLPCIQSIQKFEPDENILVLDNCSDTPYPSGAVIRTDERVCLSKAQNICLEAARKHGERFLIIINNDVLCLGKYRERVGQMDLNTVWGNKLHERNDRVWVDGWLWVLSLDLWEDVGPFDEEFKVASFEDADFCFRALEKGYKTKKCNLPFYHFETFRRGQEPNFRQYRIDNMQRIKDKHGFDV